MKVKKAPSGGGPVLTVIRVWSLSSADSLWTFELGGSMSPCGVCTHGDHKRPPCTCTDNTRNDRYISALF